MKGEKLAVSIFIVGMCCVVPLAVVLIIIRLAKDVAHSIRLKLGLLHQTQAPLPIIEVGPKGDIPQPETPSIVNKLSVHR